MRYTWDANEIKNDLKKLKYLLENEQDNKKKELIATYIELSKNRLSVIANTEFEYEDIDIKDLEIKDIVEFFFSDVSKTDIPIINMLLKTWNIVKNVSEEPIITTVIASNNDNLIKNTEEFLKTYTNKNMYQQYKKFIKENPNYLHIKKKNNEYTSGNTYIDCLLKKKSIVMYRDNTYMDLVTLPHELFHALLNNYNCYLSDNNQMFYIHEVEGSFANLLAADFYSKKNQEIAQEINFGFLQTYHNMIEVFLVYQAYENACKNNHLKKSKFDKFLNVSGINDIITKNDTKQILNVSGAGLINYSASYLTSLDLYEIYKKDKELAFYLLKNIMYSLNDEDLIKCLRRNHITFMDDNYENLKKHVKRIGTN